MLREITIHGVFAGYPPLRSGHVVFTYDSIASNLSLHCIAMPGETLVFWEDGTIVLHYNIRLFAGKEAAKRFASYYHAPLRGHGPQINFLSLDEASK